MADMSMEVVQNIFASANTPAQTYLNNTIIVDIGIIGATKEGRARVYTSRLKGEQQVIYEDVELLFIGNARGAMNTSCAGALCLLIAPATQMPDTRTLGVGISNQPYSTSALKAIPLSNNTNTSVEVGYDEIGNFVLSTVNYTCCFGEGNVTLFSGKKTAVTMSADGTLITSLSNGLLRGNTLPNGTVFRIAFDSNNKPTYMLIRNPDGTETIYRNGTEAPTADQLEDMTQYNKWTVIETHNKNGATSLEVLKNGSESQTKIEVSNEGKITIVTQKQDFTLDASGKNIIFKCQQFKVNDTDLVVGST